ncbi:unnamed protein product, partial [Aureobasidium vineae]
VAASAQRKPPAPAANNPPCTAPAKKPPPKTKSKAHAAHAINAPPVPALAAAPPKKTQSLVVAPVLVARDQRILALAMALKLVLEAITPRNRLHHQSLNNLLRLSSLRASLFCMTI